MVTLGAGHYSKTLCLRLLCGCHNDTVALCIHGDGFLEEAVNAFLDCILEVVGTKYGRGGDNHHIHTRIDHFLICIKAHEAVLGSQGLSLVLHLLQERIGLVLECVAGGCNLDAVSGCQQVVDGTGSAASAADQPDFHFTAVDGLVGEFGNVVFTGLLQGNQLGPFVLAAAG